MNPQPGRQSKQNDLLLTQHVAELGIINLDPNSNLLTMSAESLVLFGISEENLQSTDNLFEKTIHPEDRGRVNQLFQKAIDNDETVHLDYRIVLPDGNLRWIRTRAQVITGDKGKSKNLHLTVMDITEFKAAEITACDRDAHLRAVTNTIPDPMWLKDSDGIYISCNREFERLMGTDESKIIGRTDYDFFPKECADVYLEDDRYAIASGRPTTRQEEITYSDDGHKEFVEFINTPMYSQDGAIIGVMGVAHDISERMQHEEFSEFQARRANVLLELPRIAESMDEVGFIQRGLEIMESLTDSRVSFFEIVRDDQQSIGTSIFSKRTLLGFRPINSRHYTAEQIFSIINEPDPQVINDFNKHAQKVYLPANLPELRRVISLPIIENGKVVVITVVGNKYNEYNDLDVETLQLIVNEVWRIVQRKRSSAQLRKLAQVVEQSPESIVITNLDLEIEYVNQAFIKQTGYSSEELIGNKPDILRSDKTPKETVEAMERAYSNGRNWQGEFTNRRKDGSEFIESVLIVPLRQSDGTVTHYTGINSDISEQKRITAELEDHRQNLEELVERRTRELVKAQLHAETASRAKSEFLANMSHEIRTPMNAIVGLTHLLQNADPNPEQSESLSKISRSAEHLLSIINDILDVSKIEAGKITLEIEAFSMDSLFKYIHSILREQLQDKGLTIEMECGDVPTWLIGDLTRLRQALLNYVSNAIKFSEQGTITIRNQKLEEDNERVLVRFEVQDTGIGIEPDKLQGLFQPFEQADASTTRQYGGTGLGLIITRRLAALMGGEAGAVSEPGVGSTFWFTAWLGRGEPVKEEQVEVDTIDTKAYLRSHHQGARLLLVEDNLINAEVAVSLLCHVGLVVDTAEDGLEAIQKVSATSYDLILMDIQMPKCDGLEATRRIRAMANDENSIAAGNSGIPVLAMTANVFEEDRRACLEAGMVELVGKPVEPNKLYETIIKWLTPSKI
ncbi:MAG: PAS domain S-box protein [Lysobacterales bacterium]